MFLFHALEDAHALGGGVDIAAQTAVFVFSFFQALALFLSRLSQRGGLLFKGGGFFLARFLLGQSFLMAGFCRCQGLLLVFPLLQSLLAGSFIFFQAAAQVFTVPAQHESVAAALGVGVDPLLQGLCRRFGLGFGLAEQGLSQG